MKKNIFYIGLTSLLIIGLIQTGCTVGSQKGDTDDNTNGEKIEITHALGTTVVNSNPQRVVALDFSVLENLDYMGIKPVAIPKSSIPAHLSKFKDDQSVVDVGSLTEVNLEKINEVQPDLIIMSQRLLDFYDQLSSIAPVLYPETVDSDNFMAVFEKNLDNLALIFNKKDEVEKAKSDIRKKVEEAKKITTASDDRDLILLHNRGRFSAYGSGSRFGLIHDVLGVAEAAEGLSVHRHGNPVSSEFIQKADPDIIFIIDRSRVVENNTTNKEEIENLLIKETKAAKNDRIYYLNPEVWYLAGSGITSVNIMIDEVVQAF